MANHLIKEQAFVSDLLDENGLKEGDLIQIEPLSGRRSSFHLNRTCIDFITENLKSSYDGNFCKTLPGYGKEKSHVQLKLIETEGRNNSLKSRYLIQVLKGGPIKVNGNLLLSGYIERGDICEIGFNRLIFKAKAPELDFDPQKKVLSDNKKIVNSKLPLLIVGETGTGKSSLAKKIHEESHRPGRFVQLNISSFSKNLLESELFGHVKGAFTGAMNDKRGALKEAEGGTLFIDEIDSLPLDIQTKLLLFLDDFRARAVGGSVDFEVDTRIIFASGRPLKPLVQKGNMRKDFYFRICSGHTFNLESLRDNQELIEKYCQLFSIGEGVGISQSLIEFYKTLPWPGNFRQLKGHLERKRVLSNSLKFQLDSMDESLIEQSSDLADIHRSIDVSTLKEVKIAYAKKIFFQCEKNYNEAAKKLAISSRSLRTLIKENLSCA